MLLKKLLHKLNGLHFKQDYLCIAKEQLPQTLHVYLANDNRIIKDITNLHLFVGYSPLVFAFPSFPGLKENIHLIFCHAPLSTNDHFNKKDALARLELTLVKKQEATGTVIDYYLASKGSHHFIPAFPRFINRFNNRLFNKKTGNVFLHDNLYEQVQIAYALPRTIALITIAGSGCYNLFPTDLHGQVNGQYYVISLRIGGKACQQVETTKRILLSRVHCDAYKTVYGLGKNHMRELASKDHFPFSESVSEKLQIPVPEQALAYLELALIDSFEYGIHKILLFRIENQQRVLAADATLSHIHNSYATWRFKNNLPGNYLLR